MIFKMQGYWFMGPKKPYFPSRYTVLRPLIKEGLNEVSKMPIFRGVF